LREQYLFVLSDLSEAERSIVESAIEDSYYPEDEMPEAFTGMTVRFRDHDAIEADEYGGTWLVRYEGAVYWANVQYPQTPS
jgi:hypothetical protein